MIKYLLEQSSVGNIKLGHLSHVYDIPHESPEHTNYAINLIKQFHNIRRGEKTKEKISAALKHDGGSSIHIGHDDGGYFITDKHRSERKTPTIARSHEDIDQHFGHLPEYAASLKHVLDKAHKIVPRGKILQGDLLWTPGNNKKQEKNKTSYTPNRITYHAKTEAPLGIAIHTEIDGGIAKKAKKTSYKKSSDVFIPEHDFIPHHHPYDEKTQKMVLHHISKAEEELANHNTKHLTNDHRNPSHLSKYLNDSTRRGESPTITGYMKHLKTMKEKEVGGRSTPKGKEKYQKKYDDLITHLDKNKEHFKRTLNIRNHLIHATEHILNNINHPDIETEIDGKKSQGEGVVLIHDNRPVAKLVPLNIRKALANNPRFGRIVESLQQKGILTESNKNKTHVITFMRANPIHKGHEIVINKVKEESKNRGGEHTVILSHSHDPKKNPLSPHKKLEYARNAFPDTNIITSDKKNPNILAHAQNLYNSGVKHLVVVGGSDREPFQDLLKKYNNKKGNHGYYNFASINFIQAGEKRKEKVSGSSNDISTWSASRMRKAAMEGNKKEFFSGIPKSMSNEMKEKMFNDVQGGLKESLKSFIDFLYEKRYN